MSEYDDIMKAVIAGDLKALKDFAQLIDDFPTGKDDYISSYWIIHGIGSGAPEVVEWMLAMGAPVVFEANDGYTCFIALSNGRSPTGIG